MDAKKILTNKSFCVLPWTGFELEPSGHVKNCIISTEKIGNINEKEISEILGGTKNKDIKEQMLSDSKPKNCAGCHLQEEGRNNLSSISSRLYYNKEILPSADLQLFDNTNNFDLQHVDLRWTNQCNQACVYCGPKYSSQWAKELNQIVRSDKTARLKVKDYVLKNIDKLKNVYLAGGEPLVMNENREILQKLLDTNPNVNIRVNTNLSTTATGVFELLCKFKNVHWTVSVEAIGPQYEYIRHKGNWNEFLKNLTTISNLDHKISFNMLFFILNYDSIFDTIDFFKTLGYHENSFIVGPIYNPMHWNVLNLPDTILDRTKSKLTKKIKESDHYLKNSYQNILNYISNTPWKKDIQSFYSKIKEMDDRRKISSTKVFKKVFDELDGNVS